MNLIRSTKIAPLVWRSRIFEWSPAGEPLVRKLCDRMLTKVNSLPMQGEPEGEEDAALIQPHPDVLSPITPIIP